MRREFQNEKPIVHQTNISPHWTPNEKEFCKRSSIKISFLSQSHPKETWWELILINGVNTIECKVTIHMNITPWSKRSRNLYKEAIFRSMYGIAVEAWIEGDLHNKKHEEELLQPKELRECSKTRDRVQHAIHWIQWLMALHAAVNPSRIETSMLGIRVANSPPPSQKPLSWSLVSLTDTLKV